MLKAYLHIGVEKTGTTTIQSFLARNRDALQQEGFLYPLAPGKENHKALASLASSHPGHLYDLLPKGRQTTEAEFSAYSTQMFLELKNEVQTSTCHTLVLSNEHLSSRVRPIKSITTLRDALLSIVDVVEVIVYLRRQDEAVLSEYSTSVKNGNTNRFALQPYHLIKYNYAVLLDSWSAVFGIDNLSIRLFESQEFEGGDLITDFLKTIRCPNSASFSRVAPRNISLDVVCLEYLRRLNEYLPEFVDGCRNKDRGNIHAMLADLSMGERPRLSSEKANEILERFEASNREVATRYLKRQNGLLFGSSPKPAEESNLLELDQGVAFKVTAALWRRMRRIKRGVP